MQIQLLTLKFQFVFPPDVTENQISRLQLPRIKGFFMEANREAEKL